MHDITAGSGVWESRLSKSGFNFASTIDRPEIMALRREFLNAGSPEGSKNRVPVKAEFGLHRRWRQKFFVKRLDLKLRHPKLRAFRNRMLDLGGCYVACIDQCLVAVPETYGPGKFRDGHHSRKDDGFILNGYRLCACPLFQLIEPQHEGVVSHSVGRPTKLQLSLADCADDRTDGALKFGTHLLEAQPPFFRCDRLGQSIKIGDQGQPIRDAPLQIDSRAWMAWAQNLAADQCADLPSACADRLGEINGSDQGGRLLE